MYVYLDASDNVVAAATIERTLEEVQVEVPSAATKIDGGPSGLCVKNSETWDCPHYHQKTSGDGTLFEHYTWVESLSPLKIKRMEEIREKTRSLIETDGFQYSGKTFSCTEESQRNLIAAGENASETWFTYPLYWGTVDELDELVLSDQADLDAFYKAAFQAGRAFYDSERSFKVAIRAATTKAEIDAVVDDR